MTGCGSRRVGYHVEFVQGSEGSFAVTFPEGADGDGPRQQSRLIAARAAYCRDPTQGLFDGRRRHHDRRHAAAGGAGDGLTEAAQGQSAEGPS